jgi:CMP/dCMP kinase
MPTERLQKILAAAGVGSRRASEEMIQAGRVTVDGRVVTELGAQADLAVNEIRVDGQPLDRPRLRYVVLHKPAGYLSGPDPRAGYPSWQDLVKLPERLFAVGRLDHDSEGLLLLTNDGELANVLAHPRYGHAKTYVVQVEGLPNPRKVRRWQHGVMLDDGPTLPARVIQLRQPPAPYATRAGQLATSPRGTSWLQITLREGRKRQVRRMVSLLGHPALRVIRTDLGPLHLGDLAPGHWRDLTPGEVQALRDAVRQSASAARTKAPPVERKAARLVVPCTIAIDGPAASGKSTIGDKLARELGYLYFDTGVMYRALTWVALDRGMAVGDEASITEVAQQVRLDVLPPTVSDGRDVTVLADGKDITWQIRRPEVDQAVSPVSAYPGVRDVMRQQQRRIALKGKVVMVGRDIGTVVLPEAELKIYLDATLLERAERRCLERRSRGVPADLEKVAVELKRRDEIDSSRQHSPLTAAKDAIVIDSSNLNVDQVMALVRGLVRRWGRRAARNSTCGERS